MYLLQQVQDFENCEQIQALFSDLPKRPYCTNAKGFCHIRTKSQAIKHAYIQPNTPFKVKWLVFDVDDPNALFAFHDNDTPRPQLIIKNPTNGYAHYCYKLAFPIALMGETNEKAVKYLDTVYNALKRKLGADLGYSGNLIKNPTHPNWRTYITGAKKSYTLDELAEYLELDILKTPKVANDDYFGRNCSVFHATRVQAYPIAHKHDYKGLYSEILIIATTENAKFDEPLYPNELKHIAKSITRYCKSPKFVAYSSAWFSRLQAHRGRQGGKKSKRPPSPTSERTQKPWLALGISRATYYRRQKKMRPNKP